MGDTIMQHFCPVAVFVLWCLFSDLVHKGVPFLHENSEGHPRVGGVSSPDSARAEQPSDGYQSLVQLPLY
jgi:hypothetical protein